MADEEKSPRPIKVVDRRWFSETGDPRVEREPTAPANTEEKSRAGGEESRPGPTRSKPPSGHGGEQAPRRDAPGGDTGGATVSLPALVEFLAQQAILLLTGAEGLEPNRDQAKIFIDFLGVLQEKTAGNLTDGEKRMLDDVLFQLRAAYVQSGR